MPRIENARISWGLTRLLLVLSALSSVGAISYNCNTVTSSGDDVDDGLVRYGDKVYICLHFLPQNVKVGFKVEVDVHVALTVRDMFPSFLHQDTDVIVQLSNSEYLSPQIVNSSAIHSPERQQSLPNRVHPNFD